MINLVSFIRTISHVHHHGSHGPVLRQAAWASMLMFFFAAQALADDIDDVDGSLQVGVCQRDITPISPSLAANYQAAFGVAGAVNHTDPIFLAGFGDNRVATGYNDRLWARGVVVQRGEVRVAIVSLDLVGYFKNEVDTIRALVAPELEIDHVVVSSSHQHEGPDTLGIWGPDPVTSGIDYAYLDFINASVADCIEDATASLIPGRVYYSTTDSRGLSLGLDPEDDGFGVGDGKVLQGDIDITVDTQGRIVDPTIATMQFTQRDDDPGNVLATVINFASHPESLGSNNTLVTSDFPHYVRERLEAEYGGTAIWISGDLGVLQGPLDIDVLDPVTNQPAPRRTFRFADVHGTQLAERAIEALNQVRFNPGGKPVPGQGEVNPEIRYATVDPVPVRLDNPYFRFFIAIGVLDVRRALFTAGVEDPAVGFPFPPPFDVIPQALGEDLHTEVSALQIGRAKFSVVPSELDPQIGVGYRAMLEQQDKTSANQQRKQRIHSFIIGLGNDSIGYQLPAAKWDDSCHACAPFILAGVPQFCPLFPNIDCNTVFQNNVGAGVDPAISGAMQQAINGLQ